MKNAISVDVEDYFQVSAFAGQIKRADWDGLDRRVEGNTEGVLELFDEAGARGTFFTLGWVAERHPQLIRRIYEAGHELASHGFEHKRVSEQTPDEFRADIRRTKQILEDLTGAPVTGYRAASFSISADTLWAFEILAEEEQWLSTSVNTHRTLRSRASISSPEISA